MEKDESGSNRPGSTPPARAGNLDGVRDFYNPLQYDALVKMPVNPLSIRLGRCSLGEAVLALIDCWTRRRR